MPRVTTILLALLALLLTAAPARAQFAPPDEAMPSVTATTDTATLQPGQQAVLAVVVDVPAGHYAQAATDNNVNLGLIPISVAPAVPEGFTAFEPILPEPTASKTIPGLAGPADTLAGRFVAYVPVLVADDAAGEATLSADVRLQVCNEAGLCYPPVTLTASVAVPIGGAVEPRDAELFADFDPAVWAGLIEYDPADAAAVDESSDERGAVFFFAAAFGAGVLFNIVPCVLPVLPLKVMGFAEAAKHDRLRCVVLALYFAAGMVAVFAALGVLMFVTGQLANWGELFGRPWFAAGVAGLLVVAAVGTFGAFDLLLPTSVYRVTPRHDTAVGNAAWGAFTALLSTPCTFGLFAAVLVWAAAQPAWLGVATLVVVGVGMATPYVALSFFPQLARKFPRAGVWPAVVKQAMGFGLLAVAAYFATPLVRSLVGPAWWWAIWGLLAAGLAWLVVRGGMLTGWKPRPVLIAAAVALVVLVPTGTLAARLANPPAGWVAYQPGVLDGLDRPVVVKFTADWCANCQTIEQLVFGSQAQVDRWRDDFDATLVKVDLTRPDAPGWSLLAELTDAKGIPFTAVLTDDGQVDLNGLYATSDLEAALRD